LTFGKIYLYLGCPKLKLQPARLSFSFLGFNDDKSIT